MEILYGILNFIIAGCAIYGFLHLMYRLIVYIFGTDTHEDVNPIRKEWRDFFAIVRNNPSSFEVVQVKNDKCVYDWIAIFTIKSDDIYFSIEGKHKRNLSYEPWEGEYRVALSNETENVIRLSDEEGSAILKEVMGIYQLKQTQLENNIVNQFYNQVETRIKNKYIQDV